MMRRTKVAASVLSAVAVLTGGGLALAGVGGGSLAGARRPASAASGTPASAAAASQPARASAAGNAGAGATTGAGPSDVVACPDQAAGGGVGGTSDVGTATHLFTRTTADGVTIRVYQLASLVFDCGPVLPPAGSATVVGGCSAGQISIEMSDATAVGEGTLELPVASSVPPGSTSSGSTSSGSTSGASGTSTTTTSTEPQEITSGASGTSTTTTSTEPQEITSGAFGVVEGDPVWWVAVEVGSDVATAQVTFADGTSDEMSPVNGVAVLAHQVTVAAGSDPYQVQGTVELLGSAGNVIATVTLPEPAPTPTPTPKPLPIPQPVPSPAPVSNPVQQSGTTGSGSSAGNGAVIACPLLPPVSVPPVISPPASSGSGSGSDSSRSRSASAGSAVS